MEHIWYTSRHKLVIILFCIGIKKGGSQGHPVYHMFGHGIARIGWSGSWKCSVQRVNEYISPV